MACAAWAGRRAGVRRAVDGARGAWLRPGQRPVPQGRPGKAGRHRRGKAQGACRKARAWRSLSCRLKCRRRLTNLLNAFLMYVVAAHVWSTARTRALATLLMLAAPA